MATHDFKIDSAREVILTKVMKNTTHSKFQSYTVLGKNADLHQKSAEIASLYGADLDKVSPDISVIFPLKKLISIDQIRELKRQIYQKPIASHFKIVVIQEADKLTREAQNSLLKIFEEPPKHAIIILEAPDKNTLLPTIVSRATTVNTQPSEKPHTKPSLINNKTIQNLLEEVFAIDDPIAWLDDQICALYEKLRPNVQKPSREASTEQIQNTIEKCIKAKKMIEASVNPKFVLANLIFSTHLD